MNWNSQPTMYSLLNHRMNLGKPEEFYRIMIKTTALNASCTDEVRQLMAELQWYGDSKPFYNVWPSVVDGFLRTKLDVPASFLVERVLRMPEALMMRFQVGGEPTVSGIKIRSILGGRLPMSDGKRYYRGFGLFIDSDNDPSEDGVFLTSSWNLDDGSVVNRGSVIEQCKEVLTDNEIDVLEASWKVFLCTAMINDNPDFAARVVLRRHQEEYEKTGDRKFVLLAREKGIVGWDIGSKVVVSPHYRNAHFGIRWTGKDRAVPKLVPIKGCIVKKSKITDVPTGYEEQKLTT